MFNLPIYSETKLLLALEYGIILSEVAKENKIELTKEIIERFEEIVTKEFRKNNPTKLSTEMIVNILATLQPE